MLRSATERSAFSLIEMIGVLAVMSILAAMLVPNVVRRIAEARGTKEEIQLKVLAEGVGDYVRARQTVPGDATWAASVAEMTGLSLAEIQRSDPGNTNTSRVYLVHPGFTPSTGSNPVSTNLTQGLAAPTNASIMILSSTKASLALPVSSGKAADTPANRAAFTNVWNWNFDLATKAPPAGWPSEWAGQGQHLRVARLNLAPLLHHVTFSNLQFPTNVPFARINDLYPRAFNATNAQNGWYWEGTVLRLYKHDSPYAGIPADPDELDMVHALAADLNLIYTGAPSGWTVP